MADSVGAQLAAVAAEGDQKGRAEGYKAVLGRLLQDAGSPSSEAGLNAFADHILDEAVPLVVSRQVLASFAAGLPRLPAATHKAAAQHALAAIGARAVSFPEQSTLLREGLAKVLEADEQWTQAAHVLQGIDLDSGVRAVEPQYKLATYVRIAMLYLEDDDPVSAETYIKKASSLIAGSKDAALELQYKTSYARIADAKRRFIDAASRYYELSSVGSRQVGGLAVGEDDLINALSAAITCAILAAAGPQRSRVLAQLYKDERSARLPVWPFLEKVYLGRILRSQEVEAFSSGLKPHQLALLPDGSTVLSKAVMQHNLLAASKLYINISVEELGALLSVDAPAAERLAAEMIAEGRLPGRIDQVDGVITFEEEGGEALGQWDKQVAGVCLKVDALLETLNAAGGAGGAGGGGVAAA